MSLNCSPPSSSSYFFFFATNHDPWSHRCENVKRFMSHLFFSMGCYFFNVVLTLMFNSIFNVVLTSLTGRAWHYRCQG